MISKNFKETFNNNILKLIELFSHEFFIVKQNQNIKCICTIKGTGQPDPTCKKCLGLGYKIKIEKVEGASQESNIPSTIRHSSDFLITKEYYFKKDYQLNKDDLIVDEDIVYKIYERANFKTFNGEHVYQKCSSIEKKFDTKVFLNNFNDIIK